MTSTRFISLSVRVNFLMLCLKDSFKFSLTWFLLQSGEGGAASQPSHGGGDHLAPRPQQAPPYQHRHRGRTGEEMGRLHCSLIGGLCLATFLFLNRHEFY